MEPGLDYLAGQRPEVFLQGFQGCDGQQDRDKDQGEAQENSEFLDQAQSAGEG